MPKATIKTKSGTEITIESDRGTIADILFAVQRRELLHQWRREEFLRNGKKPKVVGSKKLPKTATDMILKLKESGYFKEKRYLQDIRKELAKEGFHYPNTTLSPLLLKLVRKGILGRLWENKKWVYVQR